MIGYWWGVFLADTSYLDSMASLGYNPLVAIEVALAGNAADMIKQYEEASDSR